MAYGKKYICICPKCNSKMENEGDIHYCNSDVGGKDVFDFIANLPPALKHEYTDFFKYLKGSFLRSDSFDHGQTCKGIPEFLLNPRVDTYRICIAGMKNSGKTCFKLMLKQLLKAEYIKSDMSYDNVSLEENAPLPVNTSEADIIEPEYLKFNHKGKSKVFVIYDLPGNRLEKYQSEAVSRRWLECLISADIFCVFLEAKKILTCSENEIGEICEILHAVLAEYKQSSLITIPKILFMFSKCDELDENEKAGFYKFIENDRKELYQIIKVPENDVETKTELVSSLENCEISDNSDMNKILLKKTDPVGISEIINWMLCNKPAK